MEKDEIQKKHNCGRTTNNPGISRGGGTGKDKIECCECTGLVAGQIPQPLVIGEM